MADIQDLSTFTLFHETGNDLAVIGGEEEKVYITTMRLDKEAHLTKDFGASYLGDFSHSFHCFWNEMSINQRTVAWGWTNDDAVKSQLEFESDSPALWLEAYLVGTDLIYKVATSGSSDTSTPIDRLTHKEWYVHIERVGTAVTVKLYEDAFTTLYDELSITSDAADFRYCRISSSRHQVGAGGFSVSGYIEDVDFDHPASAAGGDPVAEGRESAELLSLNVHQ